MSQILIVDDEAGIRTVLAGILEDEGFVVETAQDGYQAIELAKESVYSLIFMDMKMPGINGLETYREVKRVSPGTIVVMMTGFTLEELVSDALKEGAYAVLFKPLDMGQIINIVQSVMNVTWLLVVDDRVVDREWLREILEGSGYRVSVAEDIEQAAVMVAGKHYRAILMDVRMPGIEGSCGLERIKKLDSGVKVIFLTGYAPAEAVRAALHGECYSVLTKPVDPEEMLALINSVVRE